MSYGGESGGCCGEEGYFSDLGQVENSDQEDVVDEGTGVDDELLGRDIRGPARYVEDRCCLSQR